MNPKAIFSKCLLDIQIMDYKWEGNFSMRRLLKDKYYKCYHLKGKILRILGKHTLQNTQDKKEVSIYSETNGEREYIKIKDESAKILHDKLVMQEVLHKENFPDELKEHFDKDYLAFIILHSQIDAREIIPQMEKLSSFSWEECIVPSIFSVNVFYLLFTLSHGIKFTQKHIKLYQAFGDKNEDKLRFFNKLLFFEKEGISVQMAEILINSLDERYYSEAKFLNKLISFEKEDVITRKIEINVGF